MSMSSQQMNALGLGNRLSNRMLLSRQARVASGVHRKMQRTGTAAKAEATSNMATTGEKDMGQIVTPSVFNKTSVRGISILAAIIGAGVSGKVVPGTAAIVLHVLASGVTLGMTVWVVFVAGIVMIKNMPRQTFGKVQSKLFPLFFGIQTICGAIMLATSAFGPLSGATSPGVLSIIGLGLIMALANLMVIEPAATKVMFERYALENSTEVNITKEKRSALTKKFGMYHGMSSLAALVNLLTTVAHFVWMGLLLQSVV